MMGRSHAPLAALGGLLMEPLSYATLDAGNIHLKGDGLLAFALIGAVTASATAGILPSDKNRKGLILERRLYRLGYSVIMLLAIFLTLLSIALWARGHYPSLLPHDAKGRIIWMFVWAGWGVASDIDEPNSTVSRMFAPFSMWISKGMRAIGIKHRGLTHTWMGSLVGLVVAIAAQHYLWLAYIVLFIAFAVSFRLLLPVSIQNAARVASGTKMTNVSMSLLAGFLGVVALLLTGSAEDMAPMMLAVPCGIAMHCIGDWVTNSGLAYMWPSDKKYALRLFSTGGAFESFVVRPIIVVSLLAYIALYIIVPAHSGKAPVGVPGAERTKFGIERLVSSSDMKATDLGGLAKKVWDSLDIVNGK